MEYYLIKINENFYGKRKQCLPLNSGKDDYEIALIVEEIGYKTHKSALKGMENMIKEYANRGLVVKKYSVEKTKIIKEV